MKSMTGYGRAAIETEALRVAVEVASVNRKNFDLAVSLPREWQRLEPGVGELVRSRVQRGRINVSITVESPGGGEGGLFDRNTVEAGLLELKAISHHLHLPFEPDAHLLFDIAMAGRSRSVLPEAESVSDSILGALGSALDELVEMRTREGEALQKDLAQRGQQIRQWMKEIQSASAGVVPNYREILLKRLRQTGLEFSLEDERVLKEIALFADRCDISEELVRLESHMEQFGEFLESQEAIGRKIEFLLQEVGREFNTIGSKASDSGISRLVIECKNELERIREQVQNVE
jgi:uncharacterized protein (TIGR00255 family)